MRYEGSVYRPPSEAYSLIVQATIGCSHNKCTFCSMYKDKKFKIRKTDDVIADLISEARYAANIKRIFLADGNALMLPTADLQRILATIQQYYPRCQRVGIYAAPKDVLRKSVEELRSLYEMGLGIAYLGLESGSDAILEHIKKGVTAAEMVEAAKRLKASGIKLSVTLISGLGGRQMIMEHAQKSAEVLNQMQPDYLGLLTLLLQPGVEMYDEVQRGDFQLLHPEEVVLETHELIKNLELENCVFRSNHASNYYALEGTLPQDKEKLLAILEQIAQNDRGLFKSEFFRRL